MLPISYGVAARTRFFGACLALQNGDSKGAVSGFSAFLETLTHWDSWSDRIEGDNRNWNVFLMRRNMESRAICELANTELITSDQLLKQRKLLVGLINNADGSAYKNSSQLSSTCCELAMLCIILDTLDKSITVDKIITGADAGMDSAIATIRGRWLDVRSEFVEKFG